MTEQHERLEHSALVQAWLKEPTWLEPVDEERVAAVVRHTRQVRRWPPQVDLGKFAPMVNAAKLAAASVILVLVGGLLLTALPNEPSPQPIPADEQTPADATPATEATATAAPTPTVEPAPEASESSAVTDPDAVFIELPTELPAGAETGTITTPSGPIRWVSLDNTDGGVPRDVSTAMPWQDGIAVQNEREGGHWTTQDGVTWERRRAAPLGALGYEGGTYVIVQTSSGVFRQDSKGVWTWDSAASEWTRLDAAALDRARPDGWANRGRYVTEVPAMSDGRMVFSVDYNYRLPYRRLGIPTAGNKAMKRVSGDRYALCGVGTTSRGCPKTRAADAEWLLRFKETANGLVVEDARTGRQVGTIPGASRDEVYEGTYGTRRQRFAIEGNKVVRLGSPFVVTEAPERPALPVPDDVPAGTSVTAIGSTLLAMVPMRPNEDPTDVWVRVGEEWVSGDAIGATLWPPRLSSIGNITLFAGEDRTWVLTHPTPRE